ncbi:MAG TPA: RNA methyltransferase, partial [Candidatus Hydrogenedentes bacterium]|nr:RNA methyltransferase [Candidatus Hydrogenedentota bacterium]
MVARVVGRIPVFECLRAKKRGAIRLFTLHGAKGLGHIRDEASGIPVEACDRRKLDTLACGAVHQGVVLEAEPLPVSRADEWAAGPFPADGLVVVLDGVEDPHNFGAIVRSAVACGACAVVFGKDRAAPISPTSVKSAAGAMEYVDLVRATNL